jgi:hypothetical protein
MIKTLDSGATIDISVCSFEEGKNLMKAVARELKNTKIALGAKGGILDLFQLEATDDVLNTLKDIVTGLISSDEIENALWPCMIRGTYSDKGVTHKITRDLFEDEKRRADYMPVLKEVLVYSLTPFFGSLGSLVKSLRDKGISIPK